MQLMLVAHIPGYTMVPGNPLSSYRKIVDWTYPPRVGDHVQLGLLITPVDEVVFRDDGRPEIHFLRYPNLGGMDDLAKFAQDLALMGFAGETDWDRYTLPSPRREFTGRHAERV
jgi:hypothetical protein